MTTFSVPKQIFHGENALAELENFEGKRATIVTGGSSMKKFGFLDKAKEHLAKAGFEVSVVDGVEPNPSIETCVRGGKEMAAFEPDWIIALAHSLQGNKATKIVQPNKSLPGLFKIAFNSAWQT